MRPAGRWRATAERGDAGTWHVTGPEPVGALPAFVEDLTAQGWGGVTLAGFDFPLGLPAGFGERTGLAGFRDALLSFGQGAWSSVFDVATDLHEVELRRPFFPDRPGGRSKAPWLAALGFASADALTRSCERGGPGRRAAGCLFWTMGASQVGKAALHGWREVVKPCLARDARMWPYDGSLAALVASGGLVLSETYPADAYGRIAGASRLRGSKRDRSVRAAHAADLQRSCDRMGVSLDPATAAAVREGFGPEHGHDDGFDALVGLLGMVEVATGRHPAGAPGDDAIHRWEGWILGRLA